MVVFVIGLAIGFAMGFFIIIFLDAMGFFIIIFLDVIFFAIMGFFAMGFMVDVCATTGTTRVAMPATARIWVINFME
ncbi:MAG: hypothetical protein ACRYFS_21200 [Janthinobacterium lividum]